MKLPLVARRVLEQIEGRGLVMEAALEEPGMFHLRDQSTDRLLGEFVQRDGRVVYAELRGRVFPMWRTAPYEPQLDAFMRALADG